MSMINIDDDQLLFLKLKQLMELKILLQKEVDNLKLDYEVMLKENQSLLAQLNEQQSRKAGDAF